MSSTTFYATIGTSNTVDELRTSYNNVASEMSTDVWRIPGNVTKTGSLTLNGTFTVTQQYVINSSASAASNPTNRLENRSGILYFNDDKVFMNVAVVYGYVAGGLTSTVAVASSERFTFSTATSATQTPALSVARLYLNGVSDNKVYGYFAGGQNTTSSLVVISDRVTFSTSAIAADTPSNLSAATDRVAAISDGLTYGYYLGGFTGALTARQNRILFSTGALAAFTLGNLNVVKYQPMAVSDAVTFGYICGGSSSVGTYSANVERLTFSTSLCSTSTVVLSQARAYGAGLSDGSTYGYIGGGFSGATTYAITDRITFSSGAIAAQTPANLSTVRSELAGFGDGLIYGYYLGGVSTALQATCDRVTFSTSVTAAYTPGNLTAGRRQHAGITDGAV